MRRPALDRLRAVRDTSAEVVREIGDDRVTGIAAEMAFFGVLSIFPALLAMASALGALEVIVGSDLAQRAEDGVLDFLERVLTEDASGTTEAVKRLFEDPTPGVLTLSAVIAIWSTSRAFAAMIAALDIAYDIEEHRPYLQRRLLAAGLAIGTILVTAVMLAMLVIGPLFGTGQDVADAIGLGGAFATAWNLARWPLAVLVMVGWAATIFHIGPNHHTPWRWDLPGAVLTTVIWALVSIGFRIYLDIAAGSNQVLGTLGGSLITLMWLYVLAVGLLVGGELNAVLAERHGVRQVPRADPDDEVSEE